MKNYNIGDKVWVISSSSISDLTKIEEKVIKSFRETKFGRESYALEDYYREVSAIGIFSTLEEATKRALSELKTSYERNVEGIKEGKIPYVYKLKY